MNSPTLYGLKGSRIKKKLANNKPVHGLGVWFPYPLTAEMVSLYPFDFLLLDMEHGAWDLGSVSCVLAATSGSHAALIARPANVTPSQIQALLDLGIDGVMIAHIDSLAKAEDAVAATKYPPIGNRGIGPTRTGAYLSDMSGYIRQANDSVLLWLQVESEVDDAELRQMLELEGVDGLMLGPADIAGSQGTLTEWDTPEVHRVIQKTVNVAHQVNVPFGVPGASRSQWQGQSIFISCADISAMQVGIEKTLKDFGSTEGDS